MAVTSLMFMYVNVFLGVRKLGVRYVRKLGRNRAQFRLLSLASQYFMIPS